jgi:hypothetical protein
MIFDFGKHPGRKDTPEPTANVTISVNNPAIKADANGVLTLLHAIISDRKHKLRNNRLSQQPLDQDKATPVTTTPTKDDSVDVDKNDGTAKDTNDQNKGSRQSSSIPSQKSMRPNSKPDEIPLAKFHERMEVCRSNLRFLNEMKRADVNRKVRIIKRAIKEVAEPIIEAQRISNLEKRKEEMTEGFLSSLGVLATAAVKTGAKQMLGSPLVTVAGQALKAFNKNKKPLRSIAPATKPTKQQSLPSMNFDAPEKGFVSQRIQGNGRLQYPDDDKLAAWRKKWN